MPLENVSNYIIAAGALGTAAFTLVDASKMVRGGASNHGFAFIKAAVTRLLPPARGGDAESPLDLGAVLQTLRANWLNGMPLGDQRAIAKSLIKLRFNGDTAAHLAGVTGVNAKVLTDIAGLVSTGAPLEPNQADVFGRFDLILTTILDQAYQRADQSYRNTARVWSIVAAIVLAFFGGWLVKNGSFSDYLNTSDMWKAVMTGLIATPLAPVAKDLASALSAGVRAVSLIKK